MTEHAIYTVSELTGRIKNILETGFPIIWIEGEVSNFRTPGSGHFYFTLKDSRATINAVMFANQNRHLKFKPEDGMTITGLGRVTVYEPRGTYQVILEQMMPKGTGELLAAFEQLKKKLAAEGLFDETHKKPLPWLPDKISLISSVTGAVIHDMIHVINRRFPGAELEIIPAAVQGDRAAEEVATAIQWANQRAETDVIVVARGGGSLEDLWPFNEEKLARTVFASDIPIVSAIGHETDFTICDFVADVRAPTPSAAAEMIVPVKQDLLRQCDQLRSRLNTAARNQIRHHRSRLTQLTDRLVDPRRKIIDARLSLDDHTQRLGRLFKRDLKEKRLHLSWQVESLYANLPKKLTAEKQNRLSYLTERLLHLTTSLYIKDRAQQLRGLGRRLTDLNPRTVLERGYSITRRLPDKRIVKKPEDVTPDDTIEIEVAHGKIAGIVKHITKGTS